MNKPPITAGKWRLTGNGRVVDADGDLVAQCHGEAETKTIVTVPQQLEALEMAEEIIRIARAYFPKSVRNRDTFKLELACSVVTNALLDAGYTRENKPNE